MNISKTTPPARPLTLKSVQHNPAPANDDYSAEIDAIFGDNYEKADRAFWRTSVPIAVGVTVAGAVFGANNPAAAIGRGAAHYGFLGACIGVAAGFFAGTLASTMAEVSM